MSSQPGDGAPRAAAVAASPAGSSEGTTRPLALKQVNKIAQRYLNGSVRRVGTALILRVPTSVTVDTAPRGRGCAFYEATLRELLRLLVNAGGAVEHVRCASRDEGTCEWSAEWKS